MNLLRRLLAHWGVRFAIAMIGSIVTCWWSERVTNGRVPHDFHTPTAYWWHFLGPLLLRACVSSFFLLWSLKLLIELRVGLPLNKARDAENGMSSVELRKLVWRRLAVVIAAFLVVLTGFEVVDHSVMNSDSPSAEVIMQITGWLCFLLTMGTVIWSMRRPSPRPIATIPVGTPAERSGAVRRRQSPILSSWLIWLPGIVVVLAPVGIEMKLILVAAIFLLALTPFFMAQWALTSLRSGNSERALRRLRLGSWIPGYPRAVEGNILLDAGRYDEALAVLKPLAFDSKGNPRLESTELYIYAAALSNAGDEEAAQELLERAVLVPYQPGAVKVATGAVQMTLAASLLTQKKDAARAEQLICQVLANSSNSESTQQQRRIRAIRTGYHAWALASCGRADEAKAQLENAFASLPKDAEREIAGLEYVAGDTWWTIGDLDRARYSFQRVWSLNPNCDLGMRAGKRLARIDGTL
jgi:hypothetical protein